MFLGTKARSGCNLRVKGAVPTQSAIRFSVSGVFFRHESAGRFSVLAVLGDETHDPPMQRFVVSTLPKPSPTARGRTKRQPSDEPPESRQAKLAFPRQRQRCGSAHTPHDGSQKPFLDAQDLANRSTRAFQTRARISPCEGTHRNASADTKPSTSAPKSPSPSSATAHAATVETKPHCHR